METQQQSNLGAGPGPQQNFLKEMESFFEKYLLKQAPFQIPSQAKEWIVKYGPWIDLVLLVLALPIILAAFGLGLFVMPFAAAFHPFGSMFGIVQWLVSLAAFALQIAALPGLFKRSIKSWYLLYYGILIGAVGNFIRGDVFGFIIGTAISLYILFQIKEKYR